MAYQPLYGIIRDNVGERTTHSRRGTVNNITTDILSDMGKVATFNVSIDHRIPREQTVYHAECRLKYFAGKLSDDKGIRGDLSVGRVKQLQKKIAFWHDRLSTAISKEKDRKVHVSLQLSSEVKSDNINLYINGLSFTAQDIDILRKAQTYGNNIKDFKWSILD